jgi:hypothetical protein
MTLALNPIAFSIGDIHVRWYGIIIACGILLATFMSIREGQRRQIMSDDFIDLLLWGVPIGFIGARIYYVIFEWGYFSQHPDEIIAIWNGGIAILRGLDRRGDRPFGLLLPALLVAISSPRHRGAGRDGGPGPGAGGAIL